MSTPPPSLLVTSTPTAPEGQECQGARVHSSQDPGQEASTSSLTFPVMLLCPFFRQNEVREGVTRESSVVLPSLKQCQGQCPMFLSALASIRGNLRPIDA